MVCRHKNRIQLVSAAKTRVAAVAFHRGVLVIVVRIADKDNVSRRGRLPAGIGIAEKPLDCEGVEQSIAKIIVNVTDVNHQRCQAL